jgi:hypothetical protein
MKKLLELGLVVVAVFGMVSSANAGMVKPGDSTSCKNANAITLEAKGTSAKGDRGNANAVIWKSSNFTSVPITLGPGEHNSLEGDGHVGMANKHSIGSEKVTLTKQTEFSRGDSIGDISGEVKITNTGTIDISVACN